MNYENTTHVIAEVKDGGYGQKTWKEVVDIEGYKFKIKSGKEGYLENKWPLLQEGLAVEVIWGDFEKDGEHFPFVKDFKIVPLPEGEVSPLPQAASKPKAEAPKLKNVSEEQTKESSIESQVAAKIGAQLIECGYLTGTDDLTKKVLKWVDDRL